MRRMKEGTSVVLLQSGLDGNGGRIPWSATAICETFKISSLMGRHLMRPFGIPFNGPVLPFGAMAENHPLSAKDQSRPVRPKRLARYFLWL